MKKIITLIIICIAITSPALAEWEMIDTTTCNDSGMPFRIYYELIDCDKDLNCAAHALTSHLEGQMIRITDSSLYKWKRAMYDTSFAYQIDGKYFLHNPIKVKSLKRFSKELVVFGADSGRLYFSYDDFKTLNMIKKDNNNAIVLLWVFPDDKVIECNGINCYEFNLKKNTYQKFPLKFPSKKDSNYIAGYRDLKVYNDSIIFLGLKYDNSPINESIILKSIDFGRSWIELSPVAYNLSNFVILDENHIFALCNKKHSDIGEYVSYIYESNDGGKNWQQRFGQFLSSAQYGFYDMQFSDSLNGIAIGSYNSFLRTLDGGKYWFQDHSFEHIKFGHFRAICFLPGNILIAGNEYGGIYKYDFNIQSVEEVIENKDFSISPNPLSSGTLNIKLEFDYFGKIEINIIDAIGRIVDSFSSDIDNNKSINYTPDKSLEEGVYYISLNTGTYNRTKSFVLIR